ncbi:hypothetical protein HK102_012105 [Quaeritorhiza haematococci]|nr:hypothetical protein HK102_012105 [Quaeritorhiza haematococci]
MLTLKHLVTLLAFASAGSKYVGALPQSSEMESPNQQDIASPNDPVYQTDPLQLATSEDAIDEERNESDEDTEARDLDVAQADDANVQEDSDEANVSGFKGGWGYRYGGYPFFDVKKGFGGFGKKGFGKKGFAFGKRGFGKKGLPYSGFFGKKDAEVADFDVAEAESVDVQEDRDEASVSGFKGGWGYRYGGYPFFGRKKGFGGFGKKGFGKKGFAFGKKGFGKKGWY